IAEMYKAANDDSHYQQQLKEIIRIDANAGSERSGRTRTLAARSALVLAERLYQDFAAVKLRQPFEVSLKEKQQRMDLTVKGMGRLVDYEIADVTAAATYYIAETYRDFGRSLLQSERHTNLNTAELKEYEETLDEQAFPFEEKAIKVHEKNMEMLQTGVFNEWTKKSLAQLTELMPGRYAKPEMSTGFLTAIDTYAYRSPSSQVSAPAAANADTTPSKADQTTNPTTGNADTTPCKPKQTAHPTTGNADTTPSKPDQTTHPTTGNADTTPGKPDQTTHPTTGNADTTPGKPDQTT